MGVISIVNGDYKPTNITMGAPPCRHPFSTHENGQKDQHRLISSSKKHAAK